MNSELASVFIPILIFMIPIIAILTRHQQKMAEMHRGGMNQNVNNQLAHEINVLRDEVRSLRDQVNRQALALDDRGIKPREENPMNTMTGATPIVERMEPPELPQNKF